MIIQQPNRPHLKKIIHENNQGINDQNLTTFRIRTLSNSKEKKKVEINTEKNKKQRKQKEKKTVVSVQRVRTEKNQVRSNSLKFIVRQRYETKRSQPSSDEQQQLNIVQADKYTVNTEPVYINQRQLRNRERQRQIQKLFNPKTIMKLFKHKKAQNSQIQNKTQDASINTNTNINTNMKKQKMKSQFRMNKFVAQPTQKKSSQNQQNQGKFNNQDYWKMVNQSLILAEVQHNDEISKDLKQLYNKL